MKLEGNYRMVCNGVLPISVACLHFHIFSNSSGALKAHHRKARELWQLVDGIPACRAAMSYERFTQIKSCLRFDDTRRRNRDDKLAPVSSVVEHMNRVLHEIYIPSSFLVVDEMLVEYHGRVAFKQYIPTKPGKFGIKIYW